MINTVQESPGTSVKRRCWSGQDGLDGEWGGRLEQGDRLGRTYCKAMEAWCQEGRVVALELELGAEHA